MKLDYLRTADVCDTRQVPGDLVPGRDKTLSTKNRPSTSTCVESTHTTECTPVRVTKRGNYFIAVEGKGNVNGMITFLYVEVEGVRY